MDVSIRKVKEDDLHLILDMANANSLKNISDDQKISDKGFLVSSFSLKDYQEFLEDGDYFFLAECDGEVKGFLLAYSSESIKDNDVTNKLLEKNMLLPFIVIKQIVISKGNTGKGIASKLYQYIFDVKPEIEFLSAIVTEPYNKRSIDFHKKMGFYHHCDITPPAGADGKIRNREIWYRAQAGESRKQPNTRLRYVVSEESNGHIVENLNSAISLYTHEDDLNWTKFGMLVTFMMALFVAFSYVFEKQASDLNLFLSLILVPFGYLINFLFLLKIKSGLMYMQSHKEKVRLLEGHLLSKSFNYIPLVNLNNNELISKTSKTSNALEKMPILGLVLWTLCSFLLILKHMGFIE